MEFEEKIHLAQIDKRLYEHVNREQHDRNQ
jgi:hypothetical protein